MDEDKIDIKISNYIGYIKVYKDIDLSTDTKSNKSDIVDNQSGVERRFFSGYITFPKVEHETFLYMRAFLLTLTVDIPGNEDIHSLIRLFAFNEVQASLLKRIVFGLESYGIIYNGLNTVIGELYLCQEADAQMFYDGRESKYLKYIAKVK